MGKAWTDAGQEDSTSSRLEAEFAHSASEHTARKIYSNGKIKVDRAIIKSKRNIHVRSTPDTEMSEVAGWKGLNLKACRSD